MASFTPYPPHVHHTTTRISPSTALAFLSAYLSAATTDASLHPNALLTESGPVTPSSGSNTGLVLHNLKRVEDGLNGEHLAADLTFMGFGGEGPSELLVGGVERVTEGIVGGEEDEGWQDKEEFEREQEITQGEIGERGNGIGGEVGGGFGSVGKEAGHVPLVKGTMSSGDKEDRKKRKKEKRKMDKAALEAKKKREREAEK